MPLFVKIILYVVIVAVVSVGAGYAAWACATDVLAFGRSSDTIQVTVPENASLDAIADMLHENGLIQYPWLFKLYCKFTHSAGRMDAGTYELAYNYDYHALVSGMTESGGTRTTVRVMLPEGATCAQIFALLEKNEVCTAEKLGESAANTHFDYWFLKDIPYGETNRLEGFLFPDTYDFYVNDDPDRVLEKLLSNFNRKFSDDASAQLETLNTALAERWTAKGYDESYIEAHRLQSLRDHHHGLHDREGDGLRQGEQHHCLRYLQSPVRSRELSVPERRRNDRLCARRRRRRADL